MQRVAFSDGSNLAHPHPHAAGLVRSDVALPGLTVIGVTFDAPSLLFVTLAILFGLPRKFQ